jgi:hypothetical protein
VQRLEKLQKQIKHVKQWLLSCGEPREMDWQILNVARHRRFLLTLGVCSRSVAHAILRELS